MIRINDVDNLEKALLYACERNIETIEILAQKKNKSKKEYRRQKLMAQALINWVNTFNIDYSDCRRIKAVIAESSDIERYAKIMEL